MSQKVTNEQVKHWGLEVGFDLMGVASAGAVETGDCLWEYLQRGYNGEMDYLARDVDKRIDVRRLVAGARSVVCVGLNYYAEAPARPEGLCGEVARYARGRDYHEVVKQKLHLLADRIKAVAMGPVATRCFVDTAPLLEKAWAARAGLGWIGKNGLLLNEQFGSWLVLGEIVTDLELETDEQRSDGCGECRACVDACPTGALVEPYILEARRCISYLTIESKKELPGELGVKLGNRIFGCDACQDVCPYNQKEIITQTKELKTLRGWTHLGLDEILTMNQAGFGVRFKGSCMERVKLGHMQHVAGWCRGNVE